MSSKIQAIASSNLLNNKAKVLFQGLGKDLADLSLQEKEDILIKFNDTLNQLYSTLTKPLMNFKRFRAGKPVEAYELNRVLKSTEQDLATIYQEMASIRENLANNFNALSAQAQRSRSLIAKALSDLDDYRLQNQSRGYFVLFDNFLTTRKIESNKDKYTEKQSTIDVVSGRVTLPLKEADPDPIPVVLFEINKTSNGTPGNNQEIGALSRNNPKFITDGNLDTWYEYEKVSRNEIETPLVFDFKIELEEEKVINLIEMDVVSFPSGSDPAITQLEGSNDGKIFYSFFDNYLGHTEKDAQGTEVIPLGVQGGKPISTNKLLFYPRKMKYLRMRVSDDSSYKVRTPSGVKNRIAIGIKELSIKSLGFENVGEVITIDLPAKSEISKTILKTTEYIPDDFDVEMKYSISADGGQQWHDIQPTQKIGADVPEVLNFNIDFVDSIKTESPVDELKLKLRMEKKAATKEAVGSTIKTEVEKTEFRSIGSGVKDVQLEESPIGDVRIKNIGFGSVGGESFYRITTNNILERKDGHYAALPLDVFKKNSIGIDTEVLFIEDVIWSRVEDLTLHGSDERVYVFDYINNKIKFAHIESDVQYGKKPTEEIFFKLKREPALFNKTDKIRVETKFSNDGVQDSIKLYQIKETETVITKKLQQRKLVHPLNVTEINSVNILSDGGVILNEKEYINGYIELVSAGDYSIDKVKGMLYSFAPIEDTASAEIELGYFEKQETPFKVEDGQPVIEDAHYSINKKDKTINLSSPSYVIDLGEQNIEKGSLVFNVIRAELDTEIKYTGLGTEFIDTAEVTGPYSVDYRNGLIYLPTPITGDVSVRFNTTNYFVEYNVAQDIPLSDISINREAKTASLSDRYVIKNFSDSLVSSTQALFKVEYKYAQEIKEPPKELLEFITPILYDYRLMNVLKEDL